VTTSPKVYRLTRLIFNGARGVLQRLSGVREETRGRGGYVNRHAEGVSKRLNGSLWSVMEGITEPHARVTIRRK